MGKGEKEEVSDTKNVKIGILKIFMINFYEKD